MSKLTGKLTQTGRVMVALDAGELRGLLEYLVHTELNAGMFTYGAFDDVFDWRGVWKRQAAFASAMEPEVVAMVQRDACVRLWFKTVKVFHSEVQPLDPDAVKRIDAEYRAALERASTDEVICDGRGFFAYLPAAVLEAAAARIRHELRRRPCECGPLVGPISQVPAKPHVGAYRGCALRRDADAAIAALAEWNLQTGMLD